MRARLVFGVLLLAGTLVSAAGAPRRVYVVTWGQTELPAEGRALNEQFDRQLRVELARRGATVIESGDSRAAIVLRPSLEVLAKGIRLNLVGVRSTDQKLLGSVTMKAAGSSREAQLRAIVKRAGVEADRFE